MSCSESDGSGEFETLVDNYDFGHVSIIALSVGGRLLYIAADCLQMYEGGGVCAYVHVEEGDELVPVQVATFDKIEGWMLASCEPDFESNNPFQKAYQKITEALEADKKPPKKKTSPFPVLEFPKDDD